MGKTERETYRVGSARRRMWEELGNIGGDVQDIRAELGRHERRLQSQQRALVSHSRKLTEHDRRLGEHDEQLIDLARRTEDLSEEVGRIKVQVDAAAAWQEWREGTVKQVAEKLGIRQGVAMELAFGNVPQSTFSRHKPQVAEAALVFYKEVAEEMRRKCPYGDEPAVFEAKIQKVLVSLQNEKVCEEAARRSKSWLWRFLGW